MITTPSGNSVALTVERLRNSLAGRSMSVFAIDHAAGARGVGLELPDEIVVVFGDPRAGTPLLQRDPRVGIDLPLRMLVWDEPGTTMVGYRDPDELADTYRLDGEQERLKRMRTLLAELSAEAAAVA